LASQINASNSGFGGIVSTGDSSGVLQLQAAGTTALTIDTSQNVGIGTASPAQLLEVRKDQATSTRIKITNKTNNSASTAGLLFENSTSDVAVVQLWDSGTIGALTAYGLNMEGTGSGGVNLAASNASGVIRFATGGTTERMRISSTGTVGINQAPNTRQFSVTQNAADYVGEFTQNSATGNGVVASCNSSGTGATFFQGYSISAGATRFSVFTNGNVVNLNNSYGAISDVKLKENIVDATPKLEDLCKVKVRQYNLKSDPDHKQLGVVAQELEQVFPSMVDVSPDTDREGKDLDTTTKSVKYSVFVPMLIKAIQEQQTIINDLKARIETLEAK
jgi:hypothetical protein